MKRALVALALLWPAAAHAQRLWQDAENTNGYVPVVTPPAGSCFLYETAPFDVQCYTAIPASFIGSVPTGVLEGVAGAITGYTATNHLVQYGAASGGGLAQSTGLTFDGTSTIGIAAPASGVQESLSGNNTSSFAQLTFFPAGGTAVTELLNLIPKGAGAGAITSGIVIYNTDAFADPSNTERLLIEGRGTSGYIIDSSSTGTGTTRAIAIGTDTSVPPKQLVLNTSGSTTFGTGDLLMTRLTSQSLLKTGGGLTVGTGDANAWSLVTNNLLRMSIASTGGITVPSFSGGGNQCAFFDNTGLLSVTGSACGTGSGAGGITQLTGDGTAGPGSGSQAFTLVNMPNDVSQAGDLLATSIAAPATPSAGKARVYVDSTSKNLAVVNDAGTVNHAAQSIASLPAGLGLAGLSDNGAWTVHSFQVPLTACTDYVSIACVTGATDLGGSNTTPTVIGIETDATMRGDLLATNIAAPATPAAGKARIYVDSTSKNLAVINDAGTVNHGMQNFTCGANTFATSGAASGATTCTQPAFSGLSGSATCAQLPALAGDVTSSAGSCTTVVANLPDGVTQAGKITATEITAPANPAANHLACWADFATQNSMCKSSLGTIVHGTQDYTCAAHQFANHEGNSGGTSCAQPDFADLTGSSACAQLPALTGGVTSSAGSCATTVASVPCSALPAFSVGDVTKAAGSCTTKVTSVTDLASVQWAIGTLSNSQPLITSSVGSSIGTTAWKPFASLNYSWGISSAPFTSFSGYLYTSSQTNYAGGGGAYEAGIAAVSVRLGLVIDTNSLTGGVGNWTVTVQRNGVNTAAAFTLTSGTTGQMRTTVAVAGGAATDTYALFFSTGGGLTGGTIGFTASILISGG